MNGVLVTGIIVASVAGAIFGYILAKVQDTKHIRELADFSMDAMRGVMKEDEGIIKGLYRKIERLTEENNRLQVEVIKIKNFKPIVDPTKFPDLDVFLKVNDLPDHFNDDIDFGGKF